MLREEDAQRQQFHKDNNRHLSLDSQISLLPLGFSPHSLAIYSLCLAVTSLCHVIQAKGMLEVKRLAVELRG